MYRVFRPGDMILVLPATVDEIAPGDVICFRRNGNWIIHRALRKTGAGIRTAGDNSRKPDPGWRTPADELFRAVAVRRIHGRELPVRGGGYGTWQYRCHRFRRLLRLAAGMAGRLALRCLPRCPIENLEQVRYRDATHYYWHSRLVAVRTGERIRYANAVCKRLFPIPFGGKK